MLELTVTSVPGIMEMVPGEPIDVSGGEPCQVTTIGFQPVQEQQAQPASMMIISTIAKDAICRILAVLCIVVFLLPLFKKL